uniref:dihydrodipicolinate synthase family protein n=1 Tax=Bacteroides ovatus TaxID=28116 RepID=UPI00359C811C
MAEMKGNIVLLVTPFKNNYEIDFESLEKLLEHVITNGCEGIIALGTTGEFFSLSLEEKKQLIKFIKTTIGSRVPLCVGVGHSGTLMSIELAKYAEDLGVDCLLLPPPYYYQTTSNSIFNHFDKVLSSVKLDFMLYDGGGGTEIPFDVICNLKERNANLKYVKESMLRSDKVKKITDNLDIKVFCGDEVMLLSHLKDGAVGMGTALGNVMPQAGTEICKLYSCGKIDEAHKLYNSKIAPWVVASGIIKAEFIRFHKEALYRMGVINSPVTRPPLTELSEARLEQLDYLIKQIF